MTKQVLEFFMTLVATVVLFYMTPAAAEGHDDVKLVEKLPSNRPNEVGKSTELSGKTDNITTLSETPNTTMQEPPYNYGEEVGITGKQSSVIATNFSMESSDVGKTNISNSQDPEVPSNPKKQNEPTKFLRLHSLRIIFGIAAFMFIFIAILLSFADCIANPNTPRQTPHLHV
ncbi:unnamed protein product [Orchesella dallaii]|uniref:Uncharacterized protein n=1 Tax=Orchesella dallaii TaxID=48710 RepID=A0ABP1R499_9HEXA